MNEGYPDITPEMHSEFIKVRDSVILDVLFKRLEREGVIPPDTDQAPPGSAGLDGAEHAREQIPEGCA